MENFSTEMKRQKDEINENLRLHEEQMRILEKEMEKVKMKIIEWGAKRKMLDEMMISFGIKENTEETKNEDCKKESCTEEQKVCTEKKNVENHNEISNEDDNLNKAEEIPTPKKEEKSSNILLKDIMKAQEKSKMEEEERSPAKYYAIADGPRRGIVTTEEERRRIVEGTTWRSRSFKTKEEAEKYLVITMPRPENTGSYAERLKFKEARREATLSLVPQIRQKSGSAGFYSIFGNVQQKAMLPPNTAEPLPKLMAWLKEIQMIKGPNYEDLYGCFPIEAPLGPRKCHGLNLLGFGHGADPEAVRRAWDQGLVRILLMSAELKEIAKLPSEVIKAVERYRGKYREDIVIYCNSTLADFDEDGQCIFKPYHFMWLTRSEFPQVNIMEWNYPLEEIEFTKEEVDNIRGAQVVNILEYMRKKENMFILYKSSHIVVAKSAIKGVENPRSQELMRMDFIRSLFENQVIRSSEGAKAICRAIRKIWPNEHKCRECVN